MGGGEWKAAWRLYYWEGGAHTKIKCRWEEESGWKGDFITRGEHKISLPVRGGWVCRRKCADFVTGRWPHRKKYKVGLAQGIIHPQKSKVRKESRRHTLPPRSKAWEANTENKIKISTQSKHKVLSSRHTVKFVSHPAPVKKKEDKCATPSKASEAQCILYRIKVRFWAIRHHLTRKNVKFQR